MEKSTLLLQPLRGKFVQSTIHGHTTQVWLVDPDTNQQGTEVPYKDAIAMLALPHPVVCMAQIKGKDGKYCNLLDDEDKAEIEKKKNEYASGVVINNITEGRSSSDNSDLRDLIKTQAELIKSQSEQLKTMQNEFAKIQKALKKNEDKK